MAMSAAHSLSVSQCCQILSLCNLDDGSRQQEKIAACRSLSAQLVSTRGADFDKELALGLASLLRVHADSDMGMWAVAEESLWAVLRGLVFEPALGERVLVDLFKCVRAAEREKSRRVALARFADVCHLLAPAKGRRFITALLPVLQALLAECAEATLETLAASSPQLFAVFATHMREAEVRELLDGVCDALLKGPSAACRRACSDVAATLCAQYPRPQWQHCLARVSAVHLKSTEWPVVHGALVLLAALAREASDQMQRPSYKDPRAPLAALGPELVAVCTNVLCNEAASPMLWQGAAELAARLATALPHARERLRTDTQPMRRALRRIVLSKAAGAGGRASALKALAAWGGSRVDAALTTGPDVDPLVLGTALLNEAMRVVRKQPADWLEAGTLQRLSDAVRHESSVVARLAYESAGELMAHGSAAMAQAVAQVVLDAPWNDYWVVEKERLHSMGLMDWSLTSGHAKRVALTRFLEALNHNDPRLREAAAVGLGEAALYLGHSSVAPLASTKSPVTTFTSVHEGAWRSVPSVVRSLMRVMRGSPHSGAHAAVREIACRWSSPRHYLAKAAARHAAAQQRPLHPQWPNPLAPCFGDYAPRAVSQLLARPQLMCNLDHHQNVLDTCAAMAKGGGAAQSNAWPFVLLHCLRVVRLYDPNADPMQRGDDAAQLDGGGLPYVALRKRLATLQSSALPTDGGAEPLNHAHRAYYGLLRSSLRVMANFAKDISRPVATFGHLILDACRVALPLTPAACLSLCRCLAPLCFRPAVASPNVVPQSPAGASKEPSGTPQSVATKGPQQQQQQQQVVSSLSVSAALIYASGLGRPAPVAEDFPAALQFSSEHVQVALRMRAQLPALLEPLVLAALAAYAGTTDIKVRSRTLDLAVTLVRCGVDYRRLDPTGALVASIHQQILGKRAYLREPMRVLPSMYTFLGVLLQPGGDADDSSGAVNANVVMQVASPVFSAPYWRSNAKLLPSLRWLLRDLVVRRRMQLQKTGGSGDDKKDAFAALRAHFVSCIVAKLPHEEAVEQLEALIRAARPVKALMEELVTPAAPVVKALAQAGRLHLWQPTQWVAWRALVARMMAVPGAVEAATASSSVPEVTLDPEDPDEVMAHVSGPLSQLGGMLLCARMGTASVDKERAALLLEQARTTPMCAELYQVLRSEVEANASRRRLAFDEVPPEAPHVDEGGNDLAGVVVVAAATKMEAAQQLVGDELLNHVAALMRVASSGGVNVVRAPLDPFTACPGVPHWRCTAHALVSSWTREQLEQALPLLALHASEAVEEVPDAVYPLRDALMTHSKRLCVLSPLLSGADLDHMLRTAEALVLVDPDASAATARALSCLRGAVMRNMPTTPTDLRIVGEASQCPLAMQDPHACWESLTHEQPLALWQTPAGVSASLVDEAGTPRALQWRAALLGRGLHTDWAQAHLQQLPSEDEDCDPLLGFAVASASHPLPSVFISTLLTQCIESVARPGVPSLVRAYALVCSLLRLPVPHMAALPWIRQWTAMQQQARRHFYTPAVLRQAMQVVLDSLAPTARPSMSPMDAHERADALFRAATSVTTMRSRPIYCAELPELVLDRMTPEQGLAMLVSQLMRAARAGVDVGPIAHVLLRVLPQLPDPCVVHLYMPALSAELSSRPAVQEAVVAFLVLCVASAKRPALRVAAHYLAHTMYSTPHHTALLRLALSSLEGSAASEALRKEVVSLVGC